MKKLFLAALVSFSLTSVSGRPSGMLSRNECLADLDYLVDFIKETHPDPFSEYSERDFLRALEEVKSNIPDSLSPLDFYMLSGSLMPLLSDGHTSFFPPFDLLSDGQRFFPFYPSIDSEDLRPRMPDGDVILSINGIDSQEAVLQVMRYASGESDIYRSNVSSRLFPVVFTYHHPADSFELVYRSAEGIGQITVDAVESPARTRQKSRPEEPYRYYISEDGKTAVMEFYEFRDADKFEWFTRRMLSEMRENNIPNLIIDLRDNGGGNSNVGDRLLRFLYNKKFSQFGQMQIKISDHFKAMPSSGWAAGITNGLYPFRSGDKNSIGSKDLEKPYKKSKKLRPKGDIYVLTGKRTFSSASALAWTMQALGVAKTVGAETGGWVVHYGDLVFTRLPHSGIEAACSCKKFYGVNATDENRHGVIPDYPVDENDALRYTLNELIK